MRRLDVRDLRDISFLRALPLSPDGNECALMWLRKRILRKNSPMIAAHLALRPEKRGRNARLAPVWLDQNTLLYATSEGRGAGESVFRAVCVDGGESWEYMRIPMEVTWPCASECWKVCSAGEVSLHCAQDPSWTDGGLHGAEYIVADELPFRQDGLGITNGMRFRAYVYDPGVQSLTPISDETAVCGIHWRQGQPGGIQRPPF